MRLVYKFNIRHEGGIDRLFRVSNDLYNQALYVFRRRLEADGTWTWYNEMDKLMKETKNLEGGCNYRLLKSHVAQQTLKALDGNIKAYAKAIKDWSRHKEKYRAMPQFPHYRKRGGMFSLFYTNQACRIKSGCLVLSKDLSIPIPQWEKYKDRLCKFNQVRLVPYRDYVKVEIVYERDVVRADVDKDKCAAIDLGVDNLATMVTDEGCTIYSGKFLKSYNRFFNKTLAHLKSINDKQGIRHSTKRIARLYEKRDRYMEDALHKISKRIVDVLLEKRIGRLAVGYNVGWKTRTDMGKVGNQKFVQIPFARLTSYLRYKCELVGIEYIECNEAYTSKCDALSLEPIGRHSKYLGKRVKRGLFRSSKHGLINADQNGALNILRNVVGDSYVMEIVSSGHSLCPIRYSNPFKVA